MALVVCRQSFTWILVLSLSLPAFTQSLSWDVNLSKPKTFTSLNPSDDPGVTVADMWHISMKELMKLSKEDPVYNTYGILGNLYDKNKGMVKLSVYLYDDSKPDPNNPSKSINGRGPLLFHCYMDKTSQPGLPASNPRNYDLGNWLAWWPDANENQGGFYFNEAWKSTDSKSAALAAAFYNFNKKFGKWRRNNDDGTAVIPYSSLPDGDLKLPVIIELELYKAEVSDINIPGIGYIEADYFRPPYLDINLVIKKIFDVNSLSVSLQIPKPPSQVEVSNITINISPFGDMEPSLITKVVTREELPYSINSFRFYFPEQNGEYWIWANYDLTVKNDRGNKHVYKDIKQFLSNYHVASELKSFRTCYTIKKHNYEGLDVFTLNGGMSAEYGVEKSIASLSSGISETWDVRMKNGKPDLQGGGPVSVYPDPDKFDFLKNSVTETVRLYNDNLGAATPFNTVIIGTGVAHVPYLSNAMKAPFLPLHFLVSVHSVAEIKRILDTASAQGYSGFSMMGYDPSVDDVGVAWIKLRELPAEYIQFLKDHQVKNVIIMGYQQGVQSGESGARRIWVEGQQDADFSEGSMYMMGHGEEKTYKRFYKDYYRWDFQEENVVIDWEGGIADDQVQNISNQVNKEAITPYAISSNESLDFYQWALDIQLKLLEKNSKKPEKISMNEYLIGYPEYELYSNTVPYLYWQGLHPDNIAFNTHDFAGFKMKKVYPSGFDNIPVLIQAKADRSALLTSVKKYFPNTTMDSWQKADVWDPSDGMNSPCEIVAQTITRGTGGPDGFKIWNNQRAAIDFNDLAAMRQNSVSPAPSSDPALFPKPTQDKVISVIGDAGVQITKKTYDYNEYWQPPNFPNNIEMKSLEQGFPGKVMGYLDGQLSPPDIRRQMITTAQFDLGNTSDEYELKMGYKFNIDNKDGLLSYDPLLGEEQKMDCFEFTSIPYNHWFDIPSRMMAKNGAVWIVNGGVYDFDYNGLPGVVPFIKKEGVIKAQPQILSFKGEAAFGWNWGKNKQADIFSRPQAIPATGLPSFMRQLFDNQASSYKNVMGAMTYMSGKSGLYDITALQPDWMKAYPSFPPYYLEASRCFFAPLSLNCGGTEITAPIDDGWNNCAVLQTDNAVQRFSTLAYRQFKRTFDDVANARTFIALKGNELHIGIIDGDFGKAGLRGRLVTKSLGMHVYEESQFRLSMGYDKFVNLDGGSSTQMWLNGRGPLQMLNSYVLKNDNQGPYYSRLLSSFIMLVPKLHKELIRQTPVQVDPEKVPMLNNTHIDFNYSDEVDLNKPKAFIDLSPCKDSLNKPDGQYGLIAGNFTMSPENITKHGGVLFYTGEDMYYPDTKGLAVVQPRLRNLMVIGVGWISPDLAGLLERMPVKSINPRPFLRALRGTDVSAYYIKVYNGVIQEYFIELDGWKKYLTGDHRFILMSKGNPIGDLDNIYFSIDGFDLKYKNPVSWCPSTETSFLNIGTSTHAYIGAINLDGRFITGDIAMKPYNYLFMVGKKAWGIGYEYTPWIDQSLAQKKLPDFKSDVYYSPGVYALQCLETQGQHVFALAPPGQNRLYGLRLNNTATPPK